MTHVTACSTESRSNGAEFQRQEKKNKMCEKKKKQWKNDFLILSVFLCQTLNLDYAWKYLYRFIHLFIFAEVNDYDRGEQGPVRACAESDPGQ